MYLYRVLQDYLTDRFLVYDTQEGAKKKRITSGAAQGSVLGADLWNINYDGILRIEMPEGVFLVGYADDIVAVIRARTLELLQLKLNQTMRRVIRWMESRSLSLATQKTEIVLLTRKRIDRVIPMRVDEHTIMTSNAIRYLGVMLDGKLSFWTHIRTVADKAAGVVGKLSRLMANIGGPSPAKRRLLIRTTEAIMLYGAEVWAEALRFHSYRDKLGAVQRRGALRICSAYRTVSGPAVQVVAGAIPIDLLAEERRRIYLRKEEEAPRRVKKEERETTMEKWQNRWNTESRGRWTARLIRVLKDWTERKHGETNYYLTQFLTGHGYFRSFLVKIGKSQSRQCVYCGAEEEDAYHAFFECSHWEHQRQNLVRDVGDFEPETIIVKMISKKETWDAVNGYVISVLKVKERDREWEGDGR
uniref:Reverse transcriptase domain-containing protein n=1 Tax=Lygus hesperus TaxID=30085 RepID=A0A0A9Z5Y1_LYGHE